MLYCLSVNQDYSAIGSLTLTFPSGTATGDTHCFTLGILHDTRVENDEFFTVSLSNGQGAVVTGGSIQITIEDNDGMAISVTAVVVTLRLIFEVTDNFLIL